MPSTAPPKHRKIAIVGCRSVGKSSLTVRFVENHFVESYYPTIENTFNKPVRVKNQDFNLEIIDTAGQDEFSLLNSKHFIGIHGCIMVYSVASKHSFDMIKIIRDKVLNHLGADTLPMIIVGNKCDLKPSQRQVDKETGRKLGQELKCICIETSAQLDENVSKAFESIINEIELLNSTPLDVKSAAKCIVS